MSHHARSFEMRIPDAVQKCVLYLGIDPAEGPEPNPKWKGTCFFVSIPTEIPNFHFNYLVTAKHCAEKVNECTTFLRANSPAGNLVFVQAKKGQIKWFFHPTDGAADVAITPMGIPQNTMDYTSVPLEMLLNENERISRGIGAGNEVFVAGLFVHHVGNAKNIPIIRTGNIAMTPDERIHTNYGDMEAYLIESRSIGGLSGSPVFVVEYSPVGKQLLHLLGLIHGHWDCAPEAVVDEISEDSGIQARLNMGIAIVTPASKILEVINHPELTEMRKKKIAEEKAKRQGSGPLA